MNVTKIFGWAAAALVLSGLFGGVPAFAFPEMIRYNYVNCTSCHVSPTGGGTLTAYGRETSLDILSTWGVDGEQKAAYFINSPEWLNLGGDYRSAYSYLNSATSEMGQYNFMQLDVEAAVTYKKFTLNASLGYNDPDPGFYNGWRDALISRTHYIMYQATDEVAVRFGRFYPAFGINTPNHSLLIKENLNVGVPEQVNSADGESYNLEVSYLGDKYNVIATGIFGRPDDPTGTQREVGASLVVSRSFFDHYKAGLSYLYGTDSDEHRHLVGPYGILGFTQKLYLLTELDFQIETPTGLQAGPTTHGFAQLNRLGYEAAKGVNLIVDQEYSRVDFSNPDTLEQHYGAGVWWYPRPHLEVSLEYQKRQDVQEGSGFYDFAYFLWHIYI
jgi:hypothetical protein